MEVMTLSRRARLTRLITFAGIFGLCGIVGGAAVIEFGLHETPCVLCLLQRLGLLGVAFGGLLNLKFGDRPQHYAVSIISGLVGGAVSLRQTFLHIVPGSPPGPSAPVLGYDLWWWAFIAFVVSGVGIAAILFLDDPRERRAPAPTTATTVAFVLVLGLAAVNVLITLSVCGLGPCA